MSTLLAGIPIYIAYNRNLATGETTIDWGRTLLIDGGIIGAVIAIRMIAGAIFRPRSTPSARPTPAPTPPTSTPAPTPTPSRPAASGAGHAGGRPAPVIHAVTGLAPPSPAVRPAATPAATPPPRPGPPTGAPAARPTPGAGSAPSGLRSTMGGRTPSR
jgi:hypothetical protein